MLTPLVELPIFTPIPAQRTPNLFHDRCEQWRCSVLLHIRSENVPVSQPSPATPRTRIHLLKVDFASCSSYAKLVSMNTDEPLGFVS